MPYELQFAGKRKIVGGAVELARELVGADGVVPPYPICLDALAIAESMYVAHLRTSAAAERLAACAAERARLADTSDYVAFEAANLLTMKWAEMYVAQMGSRSRLASKLWGALGAWAAPDSPLAAEGGANMVHLRALPEPAAE